MTSYVQNFVTDLIDGMEQMKSMKVDALTIHSEGVPYYLTEKEERAYGVPGMNFTEAELFEDAQALGIIIENGFTMDFMHYFEKGEGKAVKMKASVRVSPYSASINFRYAE